MTLVCGHAVSSGFADHSWRYRWRYGCVALQQNRTSELSPREQSSMIVSKRQRSAPFENQGIRASEGTSGTGPRADELICMVRTTQLRSFAVMGRSKIIVLACIGPQMLVGCKWQFLRTAEAKELGKSHFPDCSPNFHSFSSLHTYVGKVTSLLIQPLARGPPSSFLSSEVENIYQPYSCSIRGSFDSACLDLGRSDNMTYIDPGSMTAIGVIFPVLTVLSLALRVYGWHRYPTKVEVDDILVIPAAVSLVHS